MQAVAAALQKAQQFSARHHQPAATTSGKSANSEVKERMCGKRWFLAEKINKKSR